MIGVFVTFIKGVYGRMIIAVPCNVFYSICLFLVNFASIYVRTSVSEYKGLTSH